MALLTLSGRRYRRIDAFSNSQIIQYQIALAPELVSVRLPKNWLTLSSQRHGRINAFSNSKIIRCHTVMALELVIIGFLLGIHSLMSTGVILVFPLASWIGLIWLLLFTSVYFWEFVWTHGWGNVIKIYILLNLICILIVVHDAILRKF